MVSHAAAATIYSNSDMYPDAPCGLVSSAYVVELEIEADPSINVDYPSAILLVFADGTTQPASMDRSSSPTVKRYVLNDPNSVYRQSRLSWATAELDTSGVSPEDIRFQVVEWPCPSTTSPSTSTVSGVIVQHGNQKPVAGLQVCLTELNLCTFTDTNGSFTFTDVPDGTHTLISNGPVYKPLTTTVEVSGTDVYIDLVQFRGGGQ
jgi:hypothetical protein